MLTLRHIVGETTCLNGLVVVSYHIRFPNKKGYAKTKMDGNRPMHQKTDQNENRNASTA